MKALNNRFYVKFMQLEIGLFQEISMTESHGQNSALDSTVKPYELLNMMIKS